MGFPVSPSPGDTYTAPSGAMYEYTSYGTWKAAPGQYDFGGLTVGDASDIMTALLAVDGAGSLFDADLLDGQSSAYYIDIVTRLGYTPFNAAHLPTGTKVTFQQTAAPTGWTKDVTHDNKALRVVTGTAGSGGTTTFTGVFAARTIAQNNLPNVTLATDSQGAHTHTVTPTFPFIEGGGGGVATGTSSTTYGSQSSITTSGDGAHTHTTASINGGVTQQTMDFAVQYVDLIIATKD